MATLPAAQLIHIEAIVYGTIASAGSNAKNTVNIFHYRRTTSSVNPVKANFWTTFHGFVVGKLSAMLNVRWSGAHGTCRWLDDATDAPELYSMTDVGAISGDSMPMSVSAFLEKKTALRGKSYRGGLKIGPMSESDSTLLTDDIMNAAALTRIEALATNMSALITDADGNQWQPCVFSRKLSQHLVNPTSIVTTDITVVLPRKTFGRLKRRMAKSVY